MFKAGSHWAKANPKPNETLRWYLFPYVPWALTVKVKAAGLKARSHVTSTLRFSLIFTIVFLKMQTLSANTITCCHRTILTVWRKWKYRRYIWTRLNGINGLTRHIESRQSSKKFFFAFCYRWVGVNKPLGICLIPMHLVALSSRIVLSTKEGGCAAE